MAAPKKSSKKAAPKKKAAKKTAVKKASARKAKSAKKAAPKKMAFKMASPKSESVELVEVEECKCKQKKPNGNFFCFKLVQGRWVQASGLGFPTKEVCEAALCGKES